MLKEVTSIQSSAPSQAPSAAFDATKPPRPTERHIERARALVAEQVAGMPIRYLLRCEPLWWAAWFNGSLEQRKELSTLTGHADDELSVYQRGDDGGMRIAAVAAFLANLEWMLDVSERA